MKADAILAQVLKMFQVMYLEPSTIDALLAQALRVCRKKIGPFKQITFDGTIDTPVDFFDVATAMDADGRWVEVKRVKVAGDAENPSSDTLQVVGIKPLTPPPAQLTVGYPTGFYGAGRTAYAASKAPYSLYYFVDLAKGGDIPSSVESLLFEYLQILIEIPNNQRARQVYNSTGVQIELPGDEDLKQRKDAMEADMEESAAIIPSAAVF